MATTTYNAYIAAKLSDIAALESGGEKRFNYVERSAIVDVDELVRVQRWPKCILTDGGGERDRFNGKIDRRVLLVTILVHRPRNTSGQKAAEDLATLGDAVISLLELDRTDNGIALIMDTEETAESAGDISIYMKTLAFEYEIEYA